MQVWNQQNPSAQLTANFTLAFLTATSNKGHGKLTGGAFFLALEHLNANKSDDNIRLHFNYVFKDTMNMDTMAMRAMVDTHCDKNNVSVFIGPPDFCSNAAVLATSFDIPYMSYGCRDIHSLTRNMSDYLIINEEPSGIYVSKFIVSVLQGFGWKSFWLVGGAEGVTNVWADSTSILNSLATRQGLTLNGINREPLNDAYHSSKTSSHNPYPDIINQSTRKTRVYVFLGDYNALVDFVRALHDRTGSTRGEYVVVALDDTKQQRSNKTSFLRIDETNRDVTPHDLEVFRNVLLLRSLQPTIEQKDFAKRCTSITTRILSTCPGRPFLLFRNCAKKLSTSTTP
ncbi:guanylate cyclase 32E-like isoform X2 [Pomacea canaliculata]|nr:guanylate cyclase 32E-like isoform X2 [Pomacea canaliculata]